MFEFDNFAGGSKATLDAAIEAANNGSTVIVGGGDTATVCASAWYSPTPFTLCLQRPSKTDYAYARTEYGAEDKLSHVSTGGG